MSKELLSSRIYKHHHHNSLPLNCLSEQADAYEAYANRDFQAAVQYLTDILQADTNNPRWLEMRAQVGARDQAAAL
jgi:hypothetical protein